MSRCFSVLSEEPTEASGDNQAASAGGILCPRARGGCQHVDLAMSPILLGSGEQFFANIDMVKLGYRSTDNAEGDPRGSSQAELNRCSGEVRSGPKQVL